MYGLLKHITHEGFVKLLRLILIREEQRATQLNPFSKGFILKYYAILKKKKKQK